MTMMDFKGPGFRMQVPTEWYVMSSPQYQAMFLAPPIEGEKLRTNLMVTIRPVNSDVTIKSVVELAKETQQKEYPGYKILGESPLIKEADGILIHYKWLNRDNGIPVVQQQAIFIIGSMLYTFTSTRPDSEAGAQVDGTFNEMIASLKFT